MDPAVGRSDSTWHSTLAQLKPGVAVEPVREKLNAVSRAFEEERAKGFAGMSKQSIDDWLRQSRGPHLETSGRPYTIVGVMSASFRPLPASLVGKRAELYRPVAEKHDDNERASRHLRAIARLKPEVTAVRAQAEIDVLTRRQEMEHPRSNKRRGVRVVKLRDDLVRNLRQALLVLQGTVCLN